MYENFLQEKESDSPKAIIDEIKAKQKKIIEMRILSSSPNIAQSYLEHAYQLTSLERDLSRLYRLVSWTTLALSILLIALAIFFVDLQSFIDFLFSRGEKEGISNMLLADILELPVSLELRDVSWTINVCKGLLMFALLIGMLDSLRSIHSRSVVQDRIMPVTLGHYFPNRSRSARRRSNLFIDLLFQTRLLTFILYYSLFILLAFVSSAKVALTSLPTPEAYAFVESNLGEALAVVTFILLLVLACFLDYFSVYVDKLIVKRAIPEAFIVGELISVLDLLSKESAEGKSLMHYFTVKNEIIRSLDDISDCFERHIPNRLRVKDTCEKIFLRRKFKQISNGFKSLRVWIYTPMKDTDKSLYAKLKDDLNHILVGNYDALIKLEHPSDILLSRKEIFVGQVRKWASILSRVALPFLLVRLLELTPLTISSTVRDYLLAGAFAMSALIIFIELDLAIGDKLDLLGKLKGLMDRK